MSEEDRESTDVEESTEEPHEEVTDETAEEASSETTEETSEEATGEDSGELNIEEAVAEATEGEQETAGEGGQGEGAPLEGLRERVEREEAPEAESEAEPAFEDLFTEMEAEEVDTGELWDELLAEEAESGPVTVGVPVDEEGERDIQVIDDRICHRCPHFGDPPELHCTHEGTDILEVVDVDHYKVADCPMIGAEGERKVGSEGEGSVVDKNESGS